jgi:hypothetical protein
MSGMEKIHIMMVGYKGVRQQEIQKRFAKHLRMSNLILITIISVLMLAAIPHVYGGGPRLDYDEAYADVPGAPECWVDGYDAGFANKYDEDRSWPYGCIDSGLTELECNNVKNNSDNANINHESLQEENRRNCYDDGYEDGKNNPFDQDRNQGCSDYGRAYYNGFIDGCLSVEGNTRETCEAFTDG